jgi:hypothetical protein
MVTTELVINTINMLTGRVQAQLDPLLPVAIPPNSEIVEETKDEEADEGVPALIPHAEDDDVSDDEADDDGDDDDEEEQQEVEVV